MDPQQTEKATENLGHSSVLPAGVSYIDRSFMIKMLQIRRYTPSGIIFTPLEIGG